MTDFVLLPIVGAVVSVIVQYIKSVGAKAPTWLTVALVVGFSLVAGGIYAFLKDTVAWQTSLQIALYANAVYGFIISRFE